MSGVCLWFAIRGLLDDPNAFTKTKGAFASADYRTLLPIIIATVVFYWFKACRWRLLLKPVGRYRISRDLYPYVMIGFGFNNLLPFHMGEVIRVLLFSKHARVEVSTVATSVVLERIFDSVCVLSLLCLGLAFMPGIGADIRSQTTIVACFVGALIVILLLYVLWTEKFITAFSAIFSRILPGGVLKKSVGMLAAGAKGLTALKEPKIVLAVLGLSFGNWLVNALVIHLALWSFGLPNSLPISCMVLGLTAVGAALPAAPGYFGMIQACFMTVLVLFTKDQPSILAASIYYHLVEYVMVTLIGLYFFNTTGMSFAEARASAVAIEEGRRTEPDAIEPSPAAPQPARPSETSAQSLESPPNSP